MKKTIKTILLILFLVTITGCVAKEYEEENDTFEFSYNSKTIKLDENMDDVLKDFSIYNDYKESESCAFKGLDKIYTYDHFEIYTYPDGEKDKVYQIYILNNLAKTKEGLTINDSYDQMISLYGKDYTVNGTEYSYKKNNQKLSMIIENNVVVQIAYSLIIEE